MLVGGAGVLVGDAVGVLVGGTDVLVGVAVRVLVGGIVVLVGGTDVLVGDGIAVLVEVGGIGETAATLGSPLASTVGGSHESARAPRPAAPATAVKAFTASRRESCSKGRSIQSVSRGIQPSARLTLRR